MKEFLTIFYWLGVMFYTNLTIFTYVILASELERMNNLYFFPPYILIIASAPLEYWLSKKLKNVKKGGKKGGIIAAILSTWFVRILLLLWLIMWVAMSGIAVV